MPHRVLVLSALSLLLALGCTPAGADVTGVVLADGAPVPNAIVMFIPVAGGRPVEARTTGDGAFTIHLEGREPHRVTVTAARAEAIEDKNSATGWSEKVVWLVDEKFSRPDTSDLTWDPAQAGPKFEIHVTKP
jgi:hypothetical protein